MASFLAALLGVASVAGAVRCASEDRIAGGKCLFTVDEVDPKAAVAECATSCVHRGMVGSLLAPGSAQEDEVAHDLCVEGHFRFCYIGIAEVEMTANGGFELADDGDWHRIDGNRLIEIEDGDYENWCAHEPNNGGRDQKIAGYCGDLATFDMRSYCPDTTGCWHDVTPMKDCGAVCACEAVRGGGSDAPDDPEVRSGGDRGGEFDPCPSGARAAAFVLGTLLVLSLPLAAYGALAAAQGAPVALPWKHARPSIPGGVTFSPLQGGNDAYIPPTSL